MIAKGLEENGAKVYIVGRRKDVLESVAKKEAVRPEKARNHIVLLDWAFPFIIRDGPDKYSHRNMATLFLSWAT